MASSKVWVPDPAAGYVIATVNADGTLSVKGRKAGAQPPAGTEGLALNPDDQNMVPDTTQLMHLNEAAVLENLRQRYGKDQIYTYTGYILIAVNPYKRVAGLYDEQLLHKYRGKAIGRMAPHPYAIADRAHRSMKAEKRSQSILISGESGAGKTETSKIVMQYLVKVGGSGLNEKRILDSNPILEAFGNAKTLRNNNSSRFGKFIEIHFNASANVIGASIETYLLEKSRIVYQAAGERNYHIFYQLLAGASKDLKAELQLGKPADYHYLNQSGCVSAKGIDDAGDYKALIAALGSIGVPDASVNQAMRIVAGLLHLGNATFTNERRKEDARIVDEKPVQAAAKLLGMDPVLLSRRLVTRTIKSPGKRGSTYEVPLKVQEAIYARDALAKSIYGRLFDWIVARINDSFGFTEESEAFVGILDIFGFEFFEKNSFEQFCINYANEKLQQHFNEHLFIQEKDIYVHEGIKCPTIEYQDNQEAIDLIEARPSGIIAMLDEECRLPKATDATFTARVHKSHKAHARFKEPKVNASSKITKDEAFIVRHYAAEVCYRTEGFLDKNNDTLSNDLVELAATTKLELLSTIFADAATGGAGPRRETVGSTFSRQLCNLVDTLNDTVCHFIRCIKPNEKQSPGIYEGNNILNQLRCNGMLDVLHLMHAGYPTRCPYDDLYDRFRPMLPASISDLSPPHFCEALLMALDCSRDDFALGLTRLFFRSGKLAFLEDLRGQGTELPKDIVEKVRRWIARKRLKRAMWSIYAFNKIAKRLRAIRAYKMLVKASVMAWYISRSWIRLARKARRIRSIVTVQSVIRRFIVWRPYQRRVRAARLIARRIRGWLVYKEYHPKIVRMLDDHRKQREQEAAFEAEQAALKAKEAAARKEREAKRKERAEAMQREREEEERKIAEAAAAREEERKKAEANAAKERKAAEAQAKKEAAEAAARERELQRIRDQYQQQLEEAQRRAQELEDQVGEASSVSQLEVDNLRDRLRQAEARAEALQGDRELSETSLQGKLAAALKSKADWQARYEEVMTLRDEEAEQHLAEVSQLNKKVLDAQKGASSTHRALEDQLVELRDEVDDLQAALQRSKSENQKLLDKIRQVEEEGETGKHSSEDEVQEMRVELVKVQQTARKLRKDNESANRKVDTLKKQLADEQNWKSEIMERMMNFNDSDRKEKEEMRAQILKLSSTIAKMSDAGGVSNDDMEALDKQLASLKSGSEAMFSADSSLNKLSDMLAEQNKLDEELKGDLNSHYQAQVEAFEEREQLRQEMVQKLEQENQALAEKSNVLESRVTELEDLLTATQTERRHRGSDVDASVRIALLKQENDNLVALKDAQAERITTLEEERQANKSLKTDLLESMTQQEQQEKMLRVSLDEQLAKLQERTAELEALRDEKMKTNKRLIEESKKELLARDEEIRRLARENQEAKLKKAQQPEPELATPDKSELGRLKFQAQQRKTILALWSDLQETTLERMNRQHNDLVGFSELVYLSNNRIEEIIADGRSRQNNQDLIGENKDLLELLLEQARLRKTLNDYSEEILRQTLEKMNMDSEEALYGPDAAVPRSRTTSQSRQEEGGYFKRLFGGGRR